MNDLELGWVAGLFEGEGCIHIAKGGRVVRLVVPSVDLDIIERLVSLVKIGSIYHSDYKVANGDTHTMHKWQAHKLLEVQALLRVLLPHLGKRRTAKALEALAIEPNPNGFGPRNPTRLTHCKSGLHELTGYNVMVSKKGHRRCRKCVNISQRRRDQAKRLIQDSAEQSSDSLALVQAT